MKRRQSERLSAKVAKKEKSSEDHETMDNISFVEAVKTKRPHLLILKMLDSGAVDLEEKDKDGKTALEYAVINDDVVLTRKLVSAGAAINNLSELLYLAVKCMSSCEFIKDLLKLGADLSKAESKSDDETAFLIACASGSPELVKLLLKYGGNLNDRNYLYGCPLMIAAKRGSLEIIHILVAAGANVFATSYFSQTCIFKAGNVECLKYFIRAGLNPFAVDGRKVSVLMEYVNRNSENSLECIQVLLEKGADQLQAENENLNTPLIRACEIYKSAKNNINVIKLLLDHGGNPSYQNRNKESALSIAIKGQHVELAKLLISAGANPTCKDDNTNTLLMTLIGHETENVEVFKLLLEAGANVTRRNEGGKTALMLAVQNEHLNYVKCLLEYGANPCTQDYEETSVLFDVSNKNLKLFNTIVKASVNISAQDLVGKTAAAMTAIENDNMSLANSLLKNCFKVCGEEHYGKNMLMLACILNVENVKLVELLIEKGAHLSSQDENGLTAIMIALKQNHSNTAELLIERGANLSTQCNLGNTALMYACEKGNIKIVEQLLEKNVSIFTQNNKNETAVIFAASSNHLDIVCLLLDAGARVVNPQSKSILFHVFKHRVLENTKHPFYDQALEKIIQYGVTSNNVAIVLDIIKAFAENIGNDETNLLLFYDYVKQTIELAINNITESTIVSPYRLQIHGTILSTFKDNNCFPYTSELFQIIIQSPLKYLNWASYSKSPTYFHGHFDYIMDNHKIHKYTDTFSVFIYSFFKSHQYKINEIIYNDFLTHLQKLIDNGFPVCFRYRRVVPPLTVLMGTVQLEDMFVREYPPTEVFVRRLTEKFIALGFKVSSQNIYLFRISINDVENSRMSHFRKLQIPDVLWLAFHKGYSTVLPLLLPYWSEPPLALFFFISPLNVYDARHLQTFLHKILKKLFDTLVRIGGPLPPGHQFIQEIQNNLDSCALECEGIRSLAAKFRNLHSDGPPSLKHLSRHAIRRCTKTGDDLPQRLSLLDIPIDLRSFLTLMT